MKNYVNELIAQIRALALTEIPAWINNQKENINEKEYYEQRVQLNTLVVQALTGCEIKPSKKGGYKAHFNKALPTVSQVHEIAAILDAYTKSVEVTPATDDDTAIPHTQLGIIEKCNTKKLKAAILGAGSITGEFIDGVDCIAIAAMGAEARKRQNIKLAAIIVGSTVLVAAGVTVGVVMYNKKKDAEADEDFDVEFEDSDAEEVPSVDVSTLAGDII